MTCAHRAHGVRTRAKKKCGWPDGGLCLGVLRMPARLRLELSSLTASKWGRKDTARKGR